MTSRGYLISTLENNCFYVKAEIRLHGKTINKRFKLDTGCSYSTVPYRVLYNASHDTSLKYKQQAIDAGLNILKDFDFHCGESRWNGKYLFLGCLKGQISPEYLEELHKHFGYVNLS